MKKLLTIFGSISLIASSASLVVACTKTVADTEENNGNNNENENNNQNALINKNIKKALNKLNGKKALQLAGDIIINDSNASIDFKIIEDKVIEYLVNKVANFEKSKFSAIQSTSSKIALPVITDKQVSNGQVEIEVSYDNQKVINDKDNFFKIEFGSAFTNGAKQIIDTLSNDAELKLSTIKLPIPIMEQNILTLGTIFQLLELAGPTLLEQLPTKIPKAFDIADDNWKKWDEFVNIIEQLIGAFVKDFKLDSNFELNIGPIDLEVKRIKIAISGNIKLNYRAVLDALLPTLIHFRNYLQEQKGEGTDNFLMLLVQYLFAEPQSYNDGYRDINKNVHIDHNESKEIYKFENNLEILLNNLLEGWSNAKGIFKSKEQPIAIGIKVKMGLSIPLKFKYQKDKKNKFEGLKETLPLDSITDIVSQLFNFDSDKKISLTLGTIIGFPIPSFELSLNDVLTEQNLFSLLESMRLKSEIKDHISLTWKHLKIEVYGQNKNGSWVLIKDIDGLKDVADMKITLSNSIILKDKNSDFTIELNKNKDIDFILDLKSDFLIPKI